METFVGPNRNHQAGSNGSKTGITVLVVDDEPSLRASCASVLTNDGFEVTVCGRGEEAKGLIERHKFDVVLLDLHMTGVSGMELLRQCVKVSPSTLVIIVTGNPNVNSSVEALRAGAWDYLPKPFTATHLQVLLGRARHIIQQAPRTPPAEADGARTRRPPRRETDPGTAASEPELLGRSAGFLQVIRLAEQVAKTDASVFLMGESGAGKEVIAQLIHSRSRRRGRQMVAVNCAALPETLLESEMFGHCKGAFTGAVRDKPGLLEIADGGTFFLDELTEMPLPIQAKLLRVIQDGIVRRVGSETIDARVDVRFIAATNRDPRQAVEQGILRTDLFYRLGVVPIRVPPLRERAEDIPILAEHFLQHYWRRHRGGDEPLPSFNRSAIAALIEREWRGNVRELQNVVEHAVVVLDPGCEIQPDDIPYLETALEQPNQSSRAAGWLRAPGMAGVDYHTARERIMTEFELHYIRELMTRSGSNMSRAARIAGIDRTTLYRLLQKYGLQRDSAISVP